MRPTSEATRPGGIGRKYRHPAFEGLSETCLHALYTIGELRSLEPGESLPPESGESCFCLIMKGTLALLPTDAGDDARLASYEQGDLLAGLRGESASAGEGRLLALSACSLFVLRESMLICLPPQAQGLVYRNLFRLLSEEAENQRRRHLQLGRRHARLTSELGRLLDGGSARYESSKAIRAFLEKVPSLPPYASRLSQMLLEDRASTRDVVELARLDPSLTSNVLKTVNSAYYALNHRITNFQHAALLLGFNQIYRIIVNAGVRSTMPKTPEFLRLQFHCVMISTLAQEICQLSCRGKAPLVSTLGLLHDIGRSLVLLLKKQNPRLAFLIGQLDSSRLGVLLLREWGIPGEISDSLLYQHWPESVPPEVIPETCRDNAAILYLAHLCLEALRGTKEEGRGRAFEKDYLALLGFAEEDGGDFVRQRLLPVMLKRLPTYPQPVRNFLRRSPWVGEGVPLVAPPGAPAEEAAPVMPS